MEEFLATTGKAVHDADRAARSAPVARLGRPTAVALAIALPLGPALIAALRAIMPTFSAGTAAETVQAAAAASERHSATVWLGTAAVLVLLPGVLAAARLTRAAAPRLTWWAVALLVPGYTMLAFVVAGDAEVWSANEAGLGTPAAAQLLDHGHPAIAVALAIFVVGHVVGTVLLGLALLKSRKVPAVFAWLLTISQPLHFVAFVVIGVQALDATAWTLTAIGMGAVAWALLREETPAA
ncbi:hypothetical protein [Pseudonocardia sp. GCM10023141]|uniref:hypothetical protein n=1 Tax=Pseudonocardia sp. GCM10023141 TaxID=3252653 RepID=UPI00360BF372